MRRRSRRLTARQGFTIVEVLLAISILLVGVLGFVGTSASVARMLNRGTRSNRAAFYAQERAEILSATPCQLLANGTATRGGQYSLSWTITDALGGNAKRARVIVTYTQVKGASRADTTEASILCIR
ncbi:MAG TPA: prepilin-type N-terminal cleavage/methylation domain-containing protein [Gemmatimonadaceae bacterium]|nr:prepilin-type N-terminal cleavage/methylation domain-containing protein [Gemmatimonadaceae bacterium]